MTAEEFLSRLATNGGHIVSSASLTPSEIANARASDRAYVNADGLMFVRVSAPKIVQATMYPRSKFG